MVRVSRGIGVCERGGALVRGSRGAGGWCERGGVWEMALEEPHGACVKCATCEVRKVPTRQTPHATPNLAVTEAHTRSGYRAHVRARSMMYTFRRVGWEAHFLNILAPRSDWSSNGQSYANRTEARHWWALSATPFTLDIRGRLHGFLQWTPRPAVGAWAQ